MKSSRLPVLVLLLLAFVSVVRADWPTYRGNLQRTGRIDAEPGPTKPKVEWVVRGRDHYLATPVVVDKTLYLSSLGALNTSSFTAFAVDVGDEQRVRWSKTAPYLKLPVVSAPAVAEGLVIFGDGMHQTEGAVLHGLPADGGRPLWQYPAPGTLVHLEGAPTVVDGRVYIGGGNAGVLCLDIRRLTLDGKEMSRAEVAKQLDSKWRQLVARYEEEKRTDPDFAIPPSDDSLPKPQPQLVWQQGKDMWHVDAPVAVTGDKVLAASAFLDTEQVGKRALFCLDADSGQVLWTVPLKFNAWSAPTVIDDTVIVVTSTIRFDPKVAAHAQGEVSAFHLADGQQRWQRKVAGGILSSACVHDGFVLFAATDGKVRALDLAQGRLKWSYDAGAPLFAGVATDGTSVYAADLIGVVHALELAGGAKRWTLNLASDAAVKAPGMVYGSPTLAGGKLFVATCNVERQPQDSVVVCIGQSP
jgi:outer membrane protein assembly factor BamB